ncbi:restriction endonuclease subunit S [Mycoplasmopsis felis]|uniref:restriction endonuclease subunit S n=1 Tax=Mycoplasmopsis felis TaxID=33923 RepID=UPI002AFE4BF2|nr:restriction endonuclease subunit S [Mycoplasmopsis felis]WQQ07098.1 restriction endonuclease subunit S [Mycoplasmopsis felis]
MKKVLFPRVRFKGFDEDWKEERFGELLFRINEKGYEFLETLTASKSGEMLKRKSINYHIQVAKESLKNYNRVLKNDFVLHLSTYESGLAYSKEIGITSPAYDVLRFFDKNNNDPIFFKYVFSNKKFINSLVPFTYGLRQGKSINLEELNKSLIEKTNISEQQKIGKLLDYISNLINLEEIKLNKLKQLRETLLQKMFPDGNSKTPRIRFRGFNEEWKEEKFGNILFRINEKGYEWLETLTASKSGEMLKRKSINYKVQVSKESLKKYNRVLKNDFVLHLSTYESGLAYSDEIGITSPAYDILRLFDKNNNYPLFWKYVFSNKIFINSLVPFTYGLREGKSINLEELNNNLVLKTNVSEQQKIGDFFCKIDTLINLYNSKLNKLKQIKEGLLQKNVCIRLISV